ncbi:hypothetical protein EMN47_13050 [Prolixibacteraceae bacterium JC049]|nr:hypothetical protein [Prolixibacteraceae bacterium JC049]
MCRVRIVLVLACVLAISGISKAQYKKHGTKIESGYVPLEGSDAAYKYFDVKTKLLNARLSDKSSFKVSTKFSGMDIEFEKDNEFTKDLENFYGVGFDFDYVMVMNSKWSFLGRLTPKMSSNFTDGIKGDDIYINAFAIFNYSRTKNSKLSFGVMYSSTLGTPAPLPYISYYKRFSEKWSMNVGFPVTGLSYDINEKSKLTGFFEFRGFNANISEKISDPTFIDNRLAEQVKYKDLFSGIEYVYNFNKISVKAKAGYTLSREFELRDKDKDAAYEFDMGNSFFFGFGIGFTL